MCCMIFYQGEKKIKLRSNFMKMLLPYAQEDRGEERVKSSSVYLIRRYIL